MLDDIWKEYDVKADASPVHLLLGDLHVWLQQKNEEIWIANRYKQELYGRVTAKTVPPEDLSWSRWAYKTPGDKVQVLPVFPDLPVVISSEFPLTISPGAKIQIVTRIPIWMRTTFSNSSYVLREIPSVKLSKTWFGTPLEGELCYWSTTKARRSLEGVEPRPYMVNCPIWISNKDSEDLHFEKFCFRVERLGIHRFNDELWAGETQIVHHGEDSNSDITMTGKLPTNLGKGEQLTKPRNPVHRSLATRTFKKLFDDTFITAR
ncbi:hypothetical protein NC796_25735 [Aliifodinibius sp. S!AR15-10]|uniref:hypothetical protein n=1 Tax=Aliifodinibius sp. S!AR15-10 TaxID=2950437 RepID=UPI00285586A3|nr:hypothetical protein [Aliifodinibius sp. S!AR15-10]MDR8394573.1 hypothetical protein [Aliifodinibius sp. S!AR15-10]